MHRGIWDFEGCEIASLDRNQVFFFFFFLLIFIFGSHCWKIKNHQSLILRNRVSWGASELGKKKKKGNQCNMLLQKDNDEGNGRDSIR